MNGPDDQQSTRTELDPVSWTTALRDSILEV